ncbi:MAG: hypothetical protein ACNA7J_10275, partial [Wenzhouxiangella sp.]
ARAEFIVTGKSAVEADSVTTEPGEATIGNQRHDFSINLSSLDGINQFLPPTEHQRWFLSVSEGGFINRSGRVNSFELQILDEDGNVTATYTSADPAPQQTVEGMTTELWIPDNPEIVLPGDSPAVVEADPASALQGTEQIEVGIFGAKFLPLASVEVSGEGVEVLSSSTVSGSELSATFRIAADAPAGARDVTVTNVDGQSDIGFELFTVLATGEPVEPGEPSVIELDDADPAIEYSGGWHRRQSDQASGGGYHRRMGNNNAQGNGQSPTVRLVFTGDEITYFYATSNQGGQADVFINGEFMTTVDYAGSAPGNQPAFGHSLTFDQLGDGEHEFLLVHQAGGAYVDGFRIVQHDGESGASANNEAVTSRSITETLIVDPPTGLLGVLTQLVESSIAVDADDLMVSVEVSGPDELVVVLLDPLGQLVASATELTSASADSLWVLDAAVEIGGHYLLSISSAAGLDDSYPVSVARTVPVNQ